MYPRRVVAERCDLMKKSGLSPWDFFIWTPRNYKVFLVLLILTLCLLIVAAATISYSGGGSVPDFSRSPIPELGSGLYEAGMGYVTSIKSDSFSRDVLYALEKSDTVSYNQLANNFTQKILALKNDSLSEDEVLFVEAVFFVCKAEYTTRNSEYKAALPLTGFFHQSTAETDRANSDNLYTMMTGAKTMTDIRRVHDFGKEFLKLEPFA